MTKIKKDVILGSRRWSNYFWAIVTFCGGLSFFLIGFLSYIQLKLNYVRFASNIIFIPQGATMVFYGMLAISLSIFLWLTIIWDIGSGYNEFNNNNGIITIFRQGFPGKNRFLTINYRIQDIQSIKVEINDGLAAKREIYLKTKDNKEIPLTHVSQPLLLSEIEQKASELAKFLGVFLEGIDRN